ncbi:aspartate/glutamate racemase family protein [Celeribacter sp.]|uniref:maleate cis-trans isomerase family protein n=1 Tax=Celeribacter sp. TaxID=1890673 RepID=UPI003A93FB66
MQIKARKQARASTRLGFLIPERNVACEAEFLHFIPHGMSCHFSRLPRDGAALTKESLVDMMSRVGDQAQLLSGIDPAVIMCACTSGSFLGEESAIDDLADEVTQRTGVESYTTSRAVVDALKAVNARRVFLVTPYPDEINAAEIAFLEREGFELAGLSSFRCARSEEIRALGSADVERLVMAAREEIAGADVVFISCTNLEVIERINRMETELNLPVISSNSATLWRAFRAANINTVNIGAGRLFEYDLMQAIPTKT